MITAKTINSSSDEELFRLLGKELESKISADRGALEFLAQIRHLPVGLRAMAATYELDVSLTLDDLGFHFGNWHSIPLAEETASGLAELGATELAAIFRDAFRIAEQYWTNIGSENWIKWYRGSPFERAVAPLNKEALSILRENKNGIFDYWVSYARRYPKRVGAIDADD